MFVGLAHRPLADQDLFADAQLRRVEVGIVLDDGRHRYFVTPGNGVEGLALRNGMGVERAAQLALRAAVGGRLRPERNLQGLIGTKPVGGFGVVLQDNLLAHAVLPGKRIERLSRLHGVDIELRAVDVHHRLRLLDRVRSPHGRSGERNQQGQDAEACFHGGQCFAFLGRQRISVMIFLV